MKRIISITAALICSLFFQSSVIAQEVPANPQIKDSKPVFEKPIKKEFRPSAKMPHKIRKALEFFKFADELQLTDDQIIKLRALYKKNKSEKPEPPKAPQAINFYKMTDEELVKFAEEEALKKKQRLMFKLQKIIDIRKILTKEQLDLIQKEAEKEAENNKKKFEEHKKQKPNKSRRPLFPRPGMMMPMFPPFGMMPHMSPMGCPHMGMMPPMQPMGPQCGMRHHMPPMGPQCGMRPHMPQMGCPQMGVMPPMGPRHQPKPMKMGDKPCKDKKPGHKFDKKNHAPMMNPMGFYPGFMPQPYMMNCCPCQMRPQMFGYQNKMKERRPPFDFLMKLFSCKKEKESDIIQKDKTISKEELFGNPKNESLKPNEEKK